jgi:hypothetical protein
VTILPTLVINDVQYRGIDCCGVSFFSNKDGFARVDAKDLV